MKQPEVPLPSSFDGTGRCGRLLLSAALLSLALAIPSFGTVFSATLSGAPQFAPGSSPLGGMSGCNFSSPSAMRSYSQQIVRTISSGSHSFAATAQSGVSDPFMAVYAGTFDPANPSANLVGCNDDNVGLLPGFTVNLAANATIVIVTTTWGAGVSNGTVTFNVTPDVGLIDDTPIPTPTLGEWSMIGLTLMLAVWGWFNLRQRSV